MAHPAYDDLVHKIQTTHNATFRDVIRWWADYQTITEDNATKMAEATEIITFGEQYQPNSDWVKNHWVKLTADGVAVFGQTTPAYPGQGPIENIGGVAGSAANSAIDALTGIGAWFVKNLTRIGEIIVGVVIVGIAANAMLGGKPAKTATAVATRRK